MMFPTFDADDKHWKGVLKLTSAIKLLKDEILDEEKKKRNKMINNNEVKMGNK